MTKFRYPKNWHPNWVEEKDKAHKSDVYFGKSGEKNHGHTVIKGKSVAFARTVEGRILIDKKENSTKSKEQKRAEKIRSFMNRDKGKDISGR